jgi:hypothetical protein
MGPEAQTLNTQDRLVLVTMCMGADDRDPVPVYYGGWDRLAIVLGYPEQHRVAKRAVARCVARLVEAKFIERAGTGYRGARAEYVIRRWPDQ